MGDCYEQGNNTSGLIKGGECFHRLSYYQFLEKILGLWILYCILINTNMRSKNIVIPE
jgi:hypothetical protein